MSATFTMRAILQAPVIDDDIAAAAALRRPQGTAVVGSKRTNLPGRRANLGT